MMATSTNKDGITSRTLPAPAKSSCRCSCAVVRAQALNNKGAFLTKIGKYREAIQSFHWALRIMGDSLTSLEQDQTTIVSCSCTFAVTISPELFPERMGSTLANQHTKSSISRKTTLVESMHDERGGRPLQSRSMIERFGDLVDSRHDPRHDPYHDHQDENTDVMLYTEPLHVELVFNETSNPLSSLQVVHEVDVDRMMAQQEEYDHAPKNEQPISTQAADPPTISSASPQRSVPSIIEENKKFMMNFMVAILIFNSALASHLLHTSSTPEHFCCSTPQTSSQQELPRCLTKKTFNAPRIYQQSIKLFMVLGGQQGSRRGRGDAAQLDEESGLNFDLTCELAISAALNNLILMTKNDRKNLSGDQEGNLCHTFYQIAARWYKEQEGDDSQDDIEESHHQSQGPSASSSIDSPFARHCCRWQKVFFQNAVMMQLRRLGIFCAPHAAASA